MCCSTSIAGKNADGVHDSDPESWIHDMNHDPESWTLNPACSSECFSIYCSNNTFGAVWLCLLFTLLLLKLQVPIVHDSPCQLVNGCFFIRSEAQDVNGALMKEKLKNT